MSNEHTPRPTIVPITFDELRTSVQAVGDGLFLATADAAGDPHVAFVSAGWGDQSLWIASFATSKKVANIRHRNDVALTCPASPTMNLLIRATARLVTDLAETEKLWNDGVLPYDPNAFFSGPADPLTQYVELTPTVATIHPLGPGAWHRYTR